MSQQKLYTEEQVNEIIDIAEFNKHLTNDDILKEFTPIELPSDEEIEISNPYRLGGGNYNGSAAHKWQKGVEWMKDKIQGGNK